MQNSKKTQRWQQCPQLAISTLCDMLHLYWLRIIRTGLWDPLKFVLMRVYQVCTYEVSLVILLRNEHLPQNIWASISRLDS